MKEKEKFVKMLLLMLKEANAETIEDAVDVLYTLNLIYEKRLYRTCGRFLQQPAPEEKEDDTTSTSKGWPSLLPNT